MTVGAERPVYSCILESLSATSTWHAKHNISKCSFTKVQWIFISVRHKEYTWDILPVEQGHLVNPCRSWRNPSRTAQCRHGWWHQQNRFQRDGTPRMPRIHVSSQASFAISMTQPNLSNIDPSCQGWSRLHYCGLTILLKCKGACGLRFVPYFCFG